MNIVEFFFEYTREVGALCPSVFCSTENTLYVTTREFYMSYTTGIVKIELWTIDGKYINTSHTIEYRENPVVTDIRPRNHLIVLVSFHLPNLLFICPIAIA